jgi:hypothetical protein
MELNQPNRVVISVPKKAFSLDGFATPPSRTASSYLQDMTKNELSDKIKVKINSSGPWPGMV